MLGRSGRHARRRDHAVDQVGDLHSRIHSFGTDGVDRDRGLPSRVASGRIDDLTIILFVQAPERHPERVAPWAAQRALSEAVIQIERVGHARLGGQRSRDELDRHHGHGLCSHEDRARPHLRAGVPNLQLRRAGGGKKCHDDQQQARL